MKHVPNVLIVENQDPLKEHDVGRIDHCCLCLPAGRNTQCRLSLGFTPWLGSPSQTPPFTTLKPTSNASRSRMLAPQLFCPQQCFSGLYASSRCRKHLQEEGLKRNNHMLMLLHQMLCSGCLDLKEKLCPVIHQEKSNLQLILSYHRQSNAPCPSANCLHLVTEIKKPELAVDEQLQHSEMKSPKAKLLIHCVISPNCLVMV